MDRVILIGLGGIGSHAVEALARYLAYASGPKELWLVDGDRYERKNASRQGMTARDLGRSKSEAWAERVQKMFPGLRTRAIPVYVSPGNVREIIPDKSFILMGVDNHATRQLVQAHCMKLRDVALVSAGNDYSDGNILVYVKEKGRAKTLPIWHRHREIEFPKDRRPDETGCEELANEFPQLIFANMTAATLMLNAFNELGEGRLPRYTEVYFDVARNCARAVRRA